MSKSKTPDALQQACDNFAALLAAWSKPVESHGPTWQQVVDARTACDDIRSELIRKGEISTKQVEKGDE